MSSAELDDITRSMEAALRRAYALGRQDAVNQLTNYLQSTEVASEPLALPAPADTPHASSPSPTDVSEHAASGGYDPGPVGTAEDRGSSEQSLSLRDPEPRPRDADMHMTLGRPPRGGFMEALRDFVYPSRTG